jgi:DNA/RNA endonuclease YhcR with UshA esterase domain
MKTLIPGSVILAVLAATPLAQAHHSFAAEFDTNKPVKVTGVVTKLEWQNPHIWYYVDVKNDDGSVTNWAFSGSSPIQLMRRGINKNVLQPGTVITVEGYRAKDGSNNGGGSKVTFQDGRSVFTTVADDPNEKKN